MRDASLSWEVVAPDRGRASTWRLSCPRLSIASASHGHEDYPIPAPVGRRLSQLRGSGQGEPGSRAELLHLVRELSLSCGRSRVEDLLNRRDFSSSELSERLQREGFSADASATLVERAVSCGLVDDARFAASFARSKVLAGWGRLRIERELERRGIEVADVPGWPEEFFSPDDERARARALASRRRLTGKNDLQKTVRFLCGRGFAYGLALEVARDVVQGKE